MRGFVKGFTLIETVVSLAVLGVSVALAMQLVSASLNQLRNIGNHVAAAQHADATMNDLLTREEVNRPGELSESINETYRWRAVMDEIIDPPDPIFSGRPGLPPQEPPVKKITIDLTVYWRGRFMESSLRLYTVKLVANDRLLPGGRPPGIR